MRRKWDVSFMLLVLYTLLIIALLLLVSSGARLYTSALHAQESHSTQRNVLSFIQSQIDSQPVGVYLAKGPEGPMLCIPVSESFETRIYQYAGELYTELSAADCVPSPDSGASIADVQSFNLQWAGEGLLLIEADGALAYACTGGNGHE